MIHSELVAVCNEVGKFITTITHNSLPVPGGRLMLTIAGLESDFGNKREFVRAEKVYAPGGRYYNQSLEIRQDFRRWGWLACSSFGTFQIMHPTAKELGFDDHPIRLQEDTICGYWAGQLIQKRFIAHQGAKTLSDVLDAYNTGGYKDINIPAQYIAKGLIIYDNLQGV